MEKALRLPSISEFVTSMATYLGLIPKTHKMVVDENIPDEQNVTVTFADGLIILKTWNNKKIKDTLYGEKDVWNINKTVLTVPAGDNSFTFDFTHVFNTRYSTTTYPFKNLELNYVLEPGKKYRVKGTAKSPGSFKGSELFMGIYDSTGGNTLLKEWKIGET